MGRGRDSLIVFLALMAVLFAIVLLNFDFFEGLVVKELARYGLVGLFFTSFISDSLEQPIGPEVISSLAIALGFDVLSVFIFTSLGSMCGGLFSFFVGKKFLFYRVQNSCHVSKYRNYCRIFAKHGRLSLFLAALTPVPYVFFSWMAGAFNMSLRDFFVFGMIPRVFRIALILFVVGLFF